MALHPLRLRRALSLSLSLRRALSLSLSLRRRSLFSPKPISSGLLNTPRHTPTPTPFFPQLTERLFTSTTTLFRKTFDPETDEIGPDTILFEGCDYNHWLITVDFPKDSNLTREQMIETYVNTAAQVFGSVEEAKKKIYALSTTTYQGFQVECSEETSEKFKNLPGVVFVLPDSYIDPVNKEYGGDKYVNGEIFPRPPPIHYGRRGNRDRRPREQNYGPPTQENYGHGPRPQQNYGHGPRPQQNYGPPSQQNYGPPSQQNYGPPPQQSYGPRPQQNRGSPPQQNYGPQPQQNSGSPPQQNYGPSPPQNYGQQPHLNYGPPPQQGYVPPPEQNYRPLQQGYASRPHQSYGQPQQQSFVPNSHQSYGNSPNFPQRNYGPTGSGERNSVSYQGNFNQPEPGNHYAKGQGNQQGYVPPEQRDYMQDSNDGCSEGGPFEQASGGQGKF